MVYISVDKNDSTSSRVDKDIFYDERKERLNQLYTDIQLGKEPMYDFDKVIDKLLVELTKEFETL